MYTAIVLEPHTQELLKARATNLNFYDWELKCHHCTLHLGEATEEELVVYGDSFMLIVDAIGISNKAVAFRVSNIIHPKGIKIKSQNKVAHITLLVNTKDGGKAKDSNDIVMWHPSNVDFRLMGKLLTES